MVSAVQIPSDRLAPGLSHESAALSFMPIKALEPILAQIGASTVPVVIAGETGAGKEVVARRLHFQSGRTEKPFSILNCAAATAELVEAELFSDELAGGGTLLLDEIGDMESSAQAKLLQLLEDQDLAAPVQPAHPNVRLLATTHSNLQASIAKGRFRPGLYYRLNVFSISIPPLRERKDEIIPLAEFLIERYTPLTTSTRLPAEICRALINYAWPGNVRELNNVIRRWLLLREVRPIVDYLEPDGYSGQQFANRPAPDATPARTSILCSSRHGLHDVKEASRLAEMEAIVAALNAARWNRRHAAISLGVDYKALLYKMKKLGLDNHQ